MDKVTFSRTNVWHVHNVYSRLMFFEYTQSDSNIVIFSFNRKKKLNVVGSPYWMAPEVLRHDQYNETVSRPGMDDCSQLH